MNGIELLDFTVSATDTDFATGTKPCDRYHRLKCSSAMIRKPRNKSVTDVI